MVKAARFLSPKADVVFKKVFGNHESLLRSFLNAMIPLPKGTVIERLTYLTPEQVPVISEFKRTIVDVKCYDQDGNHFIVEMQMEWSKSFASRILYGSCQAYVSQLERGHDYKKLAPVYALGLINENFDDSPEFYHHYKLQHQTQKDKKIEGLEIILIELKKFKPSSDEERRLRTLWIRFLNEAVNLDDIPEDFKPYPELLKAMELAQESGYTKSELEYYNSYWDSVSSEKTLILDALEKGMEQGFEKGMEKGFEKGKGEGIIEGIEKGLQEGERKAKLETARMMKSANLFLSDIIKFTGLTKEEIERL